MMGYQLAAYVDPPETIRLAVNDAASLRALGEVISRADSSIAYRPDLGALLVVTEDGTAVYAVTYPDGPGGDTWPCRVALVCYAVVGAASVDGAAAARAASKEQMVAAVRAAPGSRVRLAL